MCKCFCQRVLHFKILERLGMIAISTGLRALLRKRNSGRDASQTLQLHISKACRRIVFAILKVPDGFTFCNSCECYRSLIAKSVSRVYFRK